MFNNTDKNLNNNPNKSTTAPITNLLEVSDDLIQQVDKGLKKYDKKDLGSGLHVGIGASDEASLPKRYQKIGTENNWSPFTPPKDMERQAYLQQGGFEVFKNTLSGFSNQFAAGFMKAGSSWDLQGVYDMAIGNTEKEYSNWLNDIADDLLEFNNEVNPIFQEGGMWNISYWANQFQSLGLSTGIIAESLGEQALLTFLTGGSGNGAALAMKARLIKSLGKQFAFGSFKGIQEAYINGLETQSAVYKKYIELGYDEETAKQKSAEAATLGYRLEAGPLMLLNGLQFASTLGKVGKMSRNVSSPTGYSSAIESAMDVILPNVKNKVVKGAIGTGVNRVSESFEEGLQNVIQQYAEHATMNPHKDFDPFNQDLVDNMIGGALGGGVFQVGGSILKKYTQGTEAKQFNYLHDQFLNGSTERFAKSYSDIESAERKLFEAQTKLDKDPNESNVKEFVKANQEYKKALDYSQAQATLESLYLDYITGKDTAFESQIEQLQGIKNAVENNDIKELTKYQLVNEKGEEKYKGSFENIKNTFGKIIQDSQDLKSMLDNVLSDTTSDFESAWEITKNQFNTKEALKALGDITTELDTKLSNDISYSQLSDEGKARFKIEKEIQLLESMGSLSDRNLQKLVGLKEDLQNLEEYSKVDKNLLGGINTNPIAKAMLGAYYYNEQIDGNNAELKDLMDHKKIQEKIEARQEKIKKEKATKANKDNKEEIKASIKEETGNLTPKDNASVEIQAVKNESNPTQADLLEALSKAGLSQGNFDVKEEPKTETIPTFNEPKIETKVQTQAPPKSSSSTPPAFVESANIQNASLNDSFSLQPHIFNSKDESHNKVLGTYTKAINTLMSNAKGLGLSMPSAKEMFNIIADFSGQDLAYYNINIFKQALDNLGISYGQELDNVHSAMTKGLEDLFGTPKQVESVTTEMLESNQAVSENKIALEEVSHKPLEVDKVPYEGAKVIEPVLKAAFLGVEFTEQPDEFGNIVKVDKETLNRNGEVDIDTILDPNQLLVGEEVQLIMDMEWVSEHPIGSKEWIANVPIHWYYKGRNLGPLTHEVKWWNKDTVGDFSYNNLMSEYERKQAQAKVIKEAKQHHENLRTHVFNNNGSAMITITNKSTGMESKNVNQTLNSVASIVPNATVAALSYENDGTPKILLGNGKLFSGIILNEFTYLDSLTNTKKPLGKGTTLIVKQVGRNKNGDPTYVAYAVKDDHNQDSMKELVKSKGRIYDAIQAVNTNAPVRTMSVEMAHKILDEVSRISGVRKNALLEMSGKVYKGMDNLNFLYPEAKDRQKYPGQLRMGFNTKGVGKQVPIVNADFSVTSRPYEEVLKEQLYTQHKFYEINKEDGSKDYILYPQPRIEYELKGVALNNNETTPVQDKEVAKVETTSAVIITEPGPLEEAGLRPDNKGLVTSTESLEEAQKNQEEISEISNSQTELVKQEFFNMALRDIYQSMVDNPKGELTNVKIREIVIQSFDNHLENKVVEILPDGTQVKFKDKYPSEYGYLKNNKESLLGLGKFSNDYTSIIKSVGDFINQELDEIIDEEGHNEKTADRAAYEVNVKTTLGLKAKLLLAGRAVVPPHKRVRESFGGFQEFYKIDDIYDGLQQVLANNSNDIDNAVKRIDGWVKVNPVEFGFLENISNIFKSSSTPVDVKKQLLYRLNQTKNQMFFGMYSQTKSGWRLQSMNSNSRDPQIVVTNYYKTNLKTNSPLVKYSKKGFKLDVDVANNLLSQYQAWKNANTLEGVSVTELSNWLSHFGIDADPVTVEKYKNANNSAFSPNSSLHGRLGDNLEKFLSLQISNTKDNPNFIFSTEDGKMFQGRSILEFQTAKFLKDFVKLEISNTFHTLKSMYIAGKTINTYSQPNFAALQIDKLKDRLDSSGLKNELQQTPFTRNSMLLSLLENDRIREGLAISFVSLNPLKQQGQKVYNDDGITAMYAGDREASFLAHFMTSEATYGQIGNFSFRGAKISSAALSDSSQLFLLHLPVIDFTKGAFDTNEHGEFVLSQDILDILHEQFVMPDADRMEAFLKAKTSTNVVGKDLSSQIFTAFPELNTLEKGDSFLLQDLHKAINTGVPVRTVLDEYKVEIDNYFKIYLKDLAEAKFNFKDGKSGGSWYDYGFISDDGSKVSILDTDYLQGRGGNSNIENVSIAAYDYSINYMLAQAQYQMLFAGDYTNYFKDDKNNFNVEGMLPNPLSLNENNSKIVDSINEIGYVNTLKNALVGMEKKAKVDLSKRLKEQISPGNRLADSYNKKENNTKYLQLMISDVENPSNTLKEIVELWYKPTAEDLTQIQELQDLVSEYEELEYKNDPKMSEVAKKIKSIKGQLEKKFPEVSDYITITGTDAQEYTTWREHLDILFNQGNIHKEDYDNIKAKLKSQSKDGVTKENKLTKEEKKIVFQPLKPLHTGMYFNDVNGFKDQRFVYVKTSSFPLLPETTINSKLDGVRKNMENLEKTKGMNVRASYQSGNKVGAIKNTISFSRLSNADIDVAEVSASAIVLDRANFSIQQDKPFKTGKNVKLNKRDEVNRGTQFEDIILGNGINLNPDKIFPNLFDAEIIEELGIEVVDGNISGIDLNTIYNSLYEKEQSILKKLLYNSLGLNSKGQWEDSIQSLEAIQKALRQQLNNQQDKEIIELVYLVEEENAQGQLVTNHYEKFEEGGIEKYRNTITGEIKDEIKANKADFKLPLWITPNSQKFESVLNAIVGNKIIRLKMPGFSSPVASEQGFSYVNEDDYTEGGIIYTEAYDPKTGLKATYITDKDGKKVLSKAQVLVANKYRDSNGQVATLPTKKVDGKIYLDTDRIDNDLLSMFSFRIPTSAHQSGAIIEIVGFLPYEQGDLMIVPKDHATQIGEDYDIDTRYVYGFNTYTNHDGDIKKVDTAFINERIAELEAKTESDLGLSKYYQEVLNRFKVFSEDKELNDLFEDESIAIVRKKEIAIERLKQLALENNITNLFKSIYSTTDENVQKTISSTLSTKFAEDTAELIDEKISTGINYSIYDDRHQNRVMMLGASGKMGIGVHSNWVVLNSLFQQVPPALRPQLFKGIDEEGGIIPFKMVLGDFESDGKLGLVTKEDLEKVGPSTMSLTVANMINQNSSTDNQKLQIMGRRNENKYTINVFALLTNLGIIDDKLKDGTTVGYPDLFISQPIIRRLVELKAKSDSIISEYNAEIDKEIEQTLLSEFGENVKWAMVKDPITGEVEELEGYMDRQEYNRVSKNLTAQTLYDNLVKGEGSYLNENQWAIYEKFKELDAQGRKVSQLQQLLNIEGQGLGISFFDVIAKKDALLSEIQILNANHMLGELESTTSIEDGESLEAQGFVYIGEKEVYNNKTEKFEMTYNFMRPTTPQNRKLINSTATAYHLWKNIFPFEDTAIEAQINEIMMLSGAKPGTKKAQDLRYEVLRGIQDFFYSYKHPVNSIFTEDIDTERKKLFFSEDGNVPLAQYLFMLKNKKHPIFQESFFRDLNFQIGFEGEESIIQYNLSEKSNFNKNSAYKILEELANDDRPIEEGKDYTYADLVKDLVKYSMLANQEKGAIGFRQYIPTSVLSKYGVLDGLRAVTHIGAVESQSKLLNGLSSNLRKYLTIDTKGGYLLQRGLLPIFEANLNQIRAKYGPDSVMVEYSEKDSNTIGIVLQFKDTLKNSLNSSLFTKQFIQHIPGYAHRLNLNKENKKNWIIDDKKGILKSKEKVEIPFITIRQKGEWKLYEHKGEGVYERIDTLGAFGVNEYTPFEHNKVSMFEGNKFVPSTGKDKKIESPIVVPAVKTVNNNTVTIAESLQNQSTYSIVESIAKNKKSKYNKVAELLLPFTREVKIVVKDLSTVGGSGGYLEIKTKEGTPINTSLGTLHEGTIYLDTDLVNSGDVEAITYALLEEILHSVTAEEVSKYINSSNTTFDMQGNLSVAWKEGFNESNAPIYITKLLAVYQQAGKAIIGKKGNNVTQEYLDKVNNSTTLNNGINRLLNLKEFIIGVTTDDTFREEMSKIEYKGKSILTRFAKAIKELLEVVVGRVNNSISENGFNAVMEMLEVTRPTIKKTKTEVSGVPPTLVEKSQKLLQDAVPQFDEKTSVPAFIEQAPKRSYFTVEKAIAQKSFRKKPLVLQEIKSDRDKPVGARNVGDHVIINPELLKQKFEEKAWTKPATLSDNSKVTPLAENEFKSFEEFFTFVLLHELAHDTLKIQEGETRGQYEDRINKAALTELRLRYESPSEISLQPKKQITVEDLLTLPNKKCK